MVTASDSKGWTALKLAVVSGKTRLVDAVVGLIERNVPPDQV